jgi:pilus assembly protein CpaB
VNLARIILIVVALAFAGVTVFLVRNYLSEKEKDIAAKQQDDPDRIAAVDVLVAERDLPAGTILNPESFRWQPWPKQALNEQYISRKEGLDPTQELLGAAVKRVISAGDPISKGKLVLKGQKGFLAGVLKPGNRAVSIPINALNATSGFILPGDLVDLVLTQEHTRTLPSGVTRKRLVSETIMEKLQILAIDQNVDDVGKAPRLGKTATVEVTPKAAEMITLARRMGQLSLLLRSLTEPDSDGPKSTPERTTPYTQNTEVSRYLNQEETVRERFLVAARDLRAGTLLQDPDFKWEILQQGTPTTGLLLRSATPIAPLRGSYLKNSIKAGQTLHDDAIIQPKEQGFIVAALQPGMRAISFPISQVTGVSGYISPGDRVDIMLTHSATSQVDQILNPRMFTETIFKNMRLLGLVQTVNAKTGRPSVAGTATVEVTPRQAEEFQIAAQLGTLSLAMRSVPSVDLPPEPDRLPWTTELSISDALVNLLVFGTRMEPELVRARQLRRGAGSGISTPHRRIIRTAPPTPPSPPPAKDTTSEAEAPTKAPTDTPPGLTKELPAAPKPTPTPPLPTPSDVAKTTEPSPEPETRIIRVYRGTGLSTVQVD